MTCILAGAIVPGGVLLVGLAVGGWTALTARGLRSLRRYRGSGIVLPDGTVTPLDAARVESSDALAHGVSDSVGDLGGGFSDGGGGGGDGGGGGGGS